ELDPDTGLITLDPRNPAGTGFARIRGRGAISARARPNLEDPTRLIKHPGDRPAPAGFGFIAPSWEPRRLFAGTYDKAWQRTRAPYLPDDFDPRYFHAAHPDLVCKRHLQGGEIIEVQNA